MAERFNAGALLFHQPTGRVLLQHRTSDAPAWPDYWGLFGGGEPQDGGAPCRRRPITTSYYDHQPEIDQAIEASRPDRILAAHGLNVKRLGQGVALVESSES